MSNRTNNGKWLKYPIVIPEIDDSVSPILKRLLERIQKLMEETKLLYPELDNVYATYYDEEAGESHYTFSKDSPPPANSRFIGYGLWFKMEFGSDDTSSRLM